MTEQQLLRMAKRRLAILRHAEEITGNVSLTCRYYGISRQCFYKWRRRYDAHGLDGLRDRSHRPQVSPNATRTEVVGKIIYLRQHYHFGPAKIAMYLKRYHDISISHSGVWRILKRLQLNRLPASQRHKRHDPTDGGGIGPGYDPTGGLGSLGPAALIEAREGQPCVHVVIGVVEVTLRRIGHAHGEMVFGLVKAILFGIRRRDVYMGNTDQGIHAKLPGQIDTALQMA